MLVKKYVYHYSFRLFFIFLRCIIFALNLRSIVLRLFPFVITLQILLFFLELLDFFDFEFIRTIHRTSEVAQLNFNFTLIGPMIILSLFWLYGVFIKQDKRGPLLVFTLIIGFLDLELGLSIASLLMAIYGLFYINKNDFITSFLLIFTVFNLLSFFHWAFFVPLSINDVFKYFGYLWIDLFYISSYLSPLITILFFFNWLIKYLLNFGFGYSPAFIPFYQKRIDKESLLILIFSIILGIYISYYPWMNAINPNQALIGVDIHYAVIWLEEATVNWSNIFDVSFGSRPLMVLFLLLFQSITGFDSVKTVCFSTLVLYPLLIISVFYLTWNLYHNSEISSWAAFLTATSYHVTVGIYAYFLTNLLALIFVNFSLSFYAKYLHTFSFKNLFLSGLFGGFVVFTHPWTFDQYFGPMLVLCLFLFFYELYTHKKTNIFNNLVPYIGFLVLFELLHIFLGGKTGLGATTHVYESVFDFEGFWNGSILMFRNLYGGYLGHILLLLLALIGIYYMPYNGMFNLYNHLFIFFTGMVFIFVDSLLKSRLLFNLPIGLYGSIGLYYFLHGNNNKNKYIVFLFSYCLSYLFVCVANII